MLYSLKRVLQQGKKKIISGKMHIIDIIRKSNIVITPKKIFLYDFGFALLQFQSAYIIMIIVINSIKKRVA